MEGVAERGRRRTGRRIEVSPDTGRFSVWPSMIERAVSHLIDNAHKWSPEKAAIEITIDGGRVSVLDQGPGIPEADLPKIFDRFYRSDESRSTPGSGWGWRL